MKAATQKRPVIAAANLAALFILAAVTMAAGPSRSVSAADPAPAHPHLDRLRLLPPVLVSGEKGWSLEERMKQYKVEAVSVAVFSGGRVVWTETRGLADREADAPATPSTLFQAGSISKPVTAAGVLKKVEAGALRLDADVNDYLKSWKLPEGPAAAGRTVTLERLLSHTAGLTVHGFPGYADGEEIPTIPQVLDGRPPANTAPVRVAFEPGTKYQYSGGGFTIAQLAMTDTFGKPFPDLERELVLGPAGMTHSTYEQPLPPAKRALAAAGYRADGRPVEGKRHTYPEMAAAGLWTTAEDLARFAIAIQRSLAGEPGALLSKEMARRMTTPVREQAGLGLFLDPREGTTWFGHDGADEGFQALLVASRDGDCRCGIAVMANSDNGVRLGQEIVRGVALDSRWKYLPPPIPLVTRTPAELAPVAGKFRVHGDEAITITLRDGRLFGAAGTPGEFALLPVSKDTFVRTDRNLRYEMSRDPQGRVASVKVVSPEGSTPTYAKRIGDDVRMPSEDLEAGRLEEALAGYRRLHAQSPSDPGIAESRLNDMGYRLAASGRLPQGLALLKLVTQLYPASANAWDSYSEVSFAIGDRTTARSAAQKVLELLPADKTADAALKERLKAAAEKRIADLFGARSAPLKKLRYGPSKSPGPFDYMSKGEFEMRYLLLIYDKESDWQSMSEAERGKMFGEYHTFTEAIKKSGHYVGGDPLQPTASATTVRVRDGKTTTTDGPFAETREQLGGYYKIEAKDLDEAAKIAARIPGARMGSIEVRPIMETS